MLKGTFQLYIDVSLGQTPVLLTQRAKRQGKSPPHCFVWVDGSTKPGQRGTPPAAQPKAALLQTQPCWEGNSDALNTLLPTVLLTATTDNKKIRNRHWKF